MAPLDLAMYGDEQRMPQLRPDEPNAPLEERLRYGSELHQAVLTAVQKRIDYSKEAMETRHDQWNQTREHCRMFVDLERSAKLGDRTTDTDHVEMPFKRAITVPLSYATLHTLLTQLMSIYASREPMWPLKGRAPEDYFRAQIMEALLHYDQHQSRGFRWLYSQMQDALMYGCGVTYDSWEREEGYITEYMPLMIPGMPPEVAVAQLGPLATMKRRRLGVKREFCNGIPVDPFNYYPDPNVSLHDVQAGGSAGHRFKLPYTTLRAKEMPRGPYFNLEHLPDRSMDDLHEDKTPAGIDLNATTYNDPGDRGSMVLEHVQWRIIPNEFPCRETPIGQGSFPEIWWFTIAEEKVVVRCHPAPTDHGEFTYSVAETDSDFHSTLSPGLIENIDGIQRFMNWMFNSHLENVQRTLNNQLVWHPRFIEQVDMEFGGPGEHIRMTNDAANLLLSGQVADIRQFLFQLPVQDVTGPSFLPIVDFLHGWAQQTTAANAPLTGAPTSTKRTATEIGTITAKASDRISILARLIDCTSIQPMIYRWVANRQQFTELEQYVRITGELSRRMGMEQIWISRDRLAGKFDYVPTSGILPDDPARQAMVWANLIGLGGQNPMLMQPGPDGRMLDFRELFNEAARRSGIRNIDHFYMQVQPDGMVQDQAQAGNMVPVDAPHAGAVM
jgi:hypothetical protein